MCRLRSERGSALAEFGPALGLLLIMFFFPMFNMLVLFAEYSTCMTLHTVQCRQAGIVSKSDALNENGLIRKQIPEYWARQGLGRFAAIKGRPSTQVSYLGTTPEIVRVHTSCTVMPWLTIPFPLQVAGMNAATTFSFDGYTPVEQ